MDVGELKDLHVSRCSREGARRMCDSDIHSRRSGSCAAEPQRSEPSAVSEVLGNTLGISKNTCVVKEAL